jgi:hypothetical protein
MLITTLNKLKKHNPCEDGWKTLLKHLGKTKSDDEPLAFLTILESNGFDDVLWCIRSAPEYEKEWRLFAVWCARQVQHLITDERSISALDIAEKYTNGEATKDELNAAMDAAMAVEGDAERAAAGAAARSVEGDAARAVAVDAVWAAARSAAMAAEGAVAGDAAWAAARAAQKEQFIKIIAGE